MRKQKYSVELKPQSKYKYALYTPGDNKLVRQSLDQKIGVTRIPQNTLIPDKHVSSKFAYDFTTSPKTRRQAYSTSKIYEKRKLPEFKLPQIRNSSFFQNPQEKSLTFSKSLKSKPSKDVYYQTCVFKGLNTEAKSPNYMLTLAANHFSQTIQALKIGRHIKISHGLEPEIKLAKKNPKFKTVFLDLDQTLIHCDQNATNYTVKLDFPVDGGSIVSAGIRVRPHCKQFLQQLSSFAQIIIFTASSASYADVVLKHLDPHNKLISHRLYRHHCTLEKGYYVKDLRTVNRRLEDSVLVDNSAYCYMLQPFNGIPILPYYHYGKDKELINLMGFLKEVLKADDVRVPIRKTFFWNKYFENDNDARKIFQSHFSQTFSS